MACWCFMRKVPLCPFDSLCPANVMMSTKFDRKKPCLIYCCSSHLLHPLHPTGPENHHHPSALVPPIIIVTVQLYLSPSAKRTGTSGGPATSSVMARSAAGWQRTSECSRAGTPRKSSAARKVPSFSLRLRNSGSLTSYSSLDTPSYCSPLKSPSQYFQICY